jgi:hypothetical protein
MRTGSGASVRARPAPAHRPAPRPRPAAAPARGARPRTRTRATRLIIPLIAILLMGIVWVNVAKLHLTTETGRVLQQAEEVQAQTAELESRLIQRDGSVRDRAARVLQMEDAPANSRQYLTAPARP